MNRLTILTTFSRNPARFDRQITCLRSWAAVGAELVVGQDSNESALEPMFDACDEIFGETLSSFGGAETIGETLTLAPGYVLLLNADVELDPTAARLPEFEEQIGDGMLIFPRTQLMAGKQEYAPFGIEGLFFDPTESPELVTMAHSYHLGQPWWDVVLPLAHQRAGKKIYRPSEPIAFHAIHELFWDLSLCHTMGVQASLDLRKPVKPTKRAMNHFSTECWNELFDWVEDIEFSPTEVLPCPTE
jgi:hypothetical protein